MNRKADRLTHMRRVLAEQRRQQRENERAQKLVDELDAELARLGDRARRMYRCVVCGKNLVAAAIGFDTCVECLTQQRSSRR